MDDKSPLKGAWSWPGKPFKILGSVVVSSMDICTDARHLTSFSLRETGVRDSKSQIPLRYLIRTSFKPALNQLRTSSEPASVMEFGFKAAELFDVIGFMSSLRLRGLSVLAHQGGNQRPTLNAALVTWLAERESGRVDGDAC